MTEIRDRVVELVKVSSEELQGHGKNFRVHPQAQKNAFRGVIEEIGVAGALVGYYSERNDGALTLIDGHMRAKDFGGEWPVLVTDLSDDEADKLLQAFDPVGQLAMTDKAMLDDLRESQEYHDASVRILLDSLGDIDGGKINPKASGGNTALRTETPEEKSIPEMELMPYEHYDYVMVVCRTTFDWKWIADRFGIEKRDGSNDHRVRKIGLGRCIPADRAISVMKAYEDQVLSLRQHLIDMDSLSDEQREELLGVMEQARINATEQKGTY